MPYHPPPHIERIEPGDREAWLLARGRDVTASQIGALFGVHEYCSPLELYHQKRRTMRPTGGSGETAAMRRGRHFEQVAVNMLREDHPDWTIHYNAEAFTYYRDPAARIGGTPDVIVEIPGRGRGVIQIKTVGAVTYRKKWLDAEGEEEPPLWILLQAETERYLTGGEFAIVAPLIVDEWFDARLPLIDVPDTPGMIDTMKAKAAAFWKGVEAGIEPPADYDQDAGLMDRLYPDADPDDEIDATGDQRIQELLRERANAMSVRRFAGKEIERIDAEIKHMMGEASVMHIGRGRTINWRNERRSGRWTAPSNGRVLRLPKTTEDIE